ncbi:LemA family protein [Thermobrachium celere]|uniref:LemA family protein n=1 Tax=Thermobrachium celere TaxID=53422 RepID=UPI00194416F0|nr:LemA family protein [Thermobrachium celere]
MNMGRLNGKIIAIAVAVLLVIWGIGSYNGLVSKSEKINETYSQIQNQLQRRADLIPNLVETVKGYAKQEKEVIQSVTDARAKLAGARTPQEQAAANNELNSALSRLLVVVENYPNLKSDANFRQLMDELAGTENRIAVARKDYNAAVKEYNVKIKRFPTVIIARIFGFTEKQYFEANPNAQNAPNVKF